MASTRLIREALAAALKKGLGEANYQVSAYALSAPTPPCFEVLTGKIEYHQAMGNTVSWRAFRIRGFLTLNADIGSQRKVDEFFENDPVVAALEKDGTLGGIVDDLIVDEADPAVFFDLAALGSPCVGGQWQLRVLT